MQNAIKGLTKKIILPMDERSDDRVRLPATPEKGDIVELFCQGLVHLACVDRGFSGRQCRRLSGRQ
jgi:hypothetical protein